MKFLLPSLLLFSFIETSSTYKVLVYNPAFGASHSNFLGKISDILIDAGHDVTMLIPVFYEHKKDLVGSEKVKKIVRVGNDPRAAKMNKESNQEEIMKKKLWTMKTEVTAMLGTLRNLSITIGMQCEYTFQQTEILEQLKNEKFDLGISESFLLCGHAIFDHIGIDTVINADSILYLDATKSALGEPAATSYYPGLFNPHLDPNSIVSRTKNLGLYLFSLYMASFMSGNELAQINSYYNGKRKNREELMDKVAYNLVNSNQYLDYPSPILPKTVFIGGMQVSTKKSGKVKLSQEWEDVLSKREKNVLISFGSNVHSDGMPENFKDAFLEVFASMPETTFIWKYETPNATIADHLPNVKLTTWMPQNDLLADERLTMFITHGGLGSTMELAYQGKPAIVIPVMGDQPRNADMLNRHGGVIQLDKNELGDADKIRTAIKTILTDESYAENARRLADILESQPNKPKDNVLKHCDFAVKFGALETLRSSGTHLNTIQYYSIDIAIVLILSLITIITILVLLVRFLWRFVTKKGSSKSSKSKKD